MTRKRRLQRQYDLAAPNADYPPWEGQPQETLIICTHQRSGSTPLGEAVYAAKELGNPLEYFHAGFRPDLVRQWRAEDVRTYLDAVYRHITAPSGVLSLKLFWPDVEQLAAEVAPDRYRLLYD